MQKFSTTSSQTWPLPKIRHATIHRNSAPDIDATIKWEREVHILDFSLVLGKIMDIHVVSRVALSDAIPHLAITPGKKKDTEQ